MQLQFDMVAKAEKDDSGYYLEGVASTTDLDSDRERFSINALQDMSKTENVPLTIGHGPNNAGTNLDDEIGTMIAAKVDKDALVARFKIDDEDPVAMRMWNKISKGSTSCLSVFGNIIHKLPPDFAKGERKVIDSVILEHVAVVKKGANKRCTITDAFKKVFKDLDAEDFSKAVDVSDEQREEHASYFEEENGKKVGKFPVFSEASARSAIKLIGHAPEGPKRDAVIEKIKKYIPDYEPGPEVKKENKMDTITLENLFAKANVPTDYQFAKEGKKFSADSISKLKAVQMAISELIGEDDKGTEDNGDGTPVTGAAEIPDVKKVDPVPDGPVTEVTDKSAKPQYDDAFIDKFAKSLIGEYVKQAKAERKSLVLREEDEEKKPLTLSEQYAKSANTRALLEQQLADAFKK